MKKIWISVIAILLSCSNTFSQTDAGDVELSASMTLGSFSQTMEAGGNSYDGESTTYFTFAVRPGFFPINSFEIEPEIFLTVVESQEPSISLSGNLSYNFNIPETGVRPFVLAGYGVGNSLPVLSILVTRSSDDFDISHLNLGAGVKILFNEHVAARIEYRYQKFYYDTDPHYYYIKYTYTSHKLMFGISFFL